MSNPDLIDVVRALVEAHDVPYPNGGGREPILVVRTAGGDFLKHHALSESPPDVDATLLRELVARGWITLDASRSAWQVFPTPEARALVERHDRVMDLDSAAGIEPLLGAISEQARSESSLSWAAVRPVLVALRDYWEADGFSPHGGSPPASPQPAS